MANLSGSWQLVSTDDNFEKYLSAVGVTPEKCQQAKAILTTNVVQHISHDGTQWTIKVSTVNGDKVDVYKEGKPTDTTTLDGRKVSVVYSLQGDELIETQTGHGYVSKNIRKVSGDTMTMKTHQLLAMYFPCSNASDCSRRK